MLSWRLWEGAAADWDDLQQQFSDYTIYQSHAWGEYKRLFGWQPLRLFAGDAGQVTSMAQVLVKRYPLGVGMAWSPGGPLGEVDLWSEHFRQAISSALEVKFLYCRISPMCEHFEYAASKLLAQGWQRTAAPLTTGLSLTYSTALSEEERLQQCSRNWRHNLRRSAKHSSNTYLWNHPDPDEIMEAYAAMQAHKQLRAQTSRKAISSKLATFAERCLVVRCDDPKGNLLALRGALVLGGKGWDTFAAATPAGRKVYASHAAFWELMKQCATRRVEWYDLGGVDLANNRGVYDFKKGMGAEDLRYLGEWEHSSPSFLGTIVSSAITWRGRA